MIPTTRSLHRFANTSRSRSHIASEFNGDEVHDNLTSDHYVPDSDRQNTMNVTIGERLEATEAVAHQESKAETSATATVTLEERVTKLEETLAKGLRVTNGLGNNPDKLEADHWMGKVSTGNSYLLGSKDLGDGIKEQHHAEGETLFENPQICLAVLPIYQNQHRVATSPTDDGVDFISGSPESFTRTMSTLDGGKDRTNDVGSRHFLLGSLHKKELQLHRLQLQEKHRLRYLDLMACHISHAVNYWTDAWQRLKEGSARENYGLRPLEAEGAHLYFDYLILIVEDMRRKGFEGPDKLVHEAWFTLMFRAFCWRRCHSFHPGEDNRHKGSPLPSRYWDCQLPVYIR